MAGPAPATATSGGPGGEPTAATAPLASPTHTPDAEPVTPWHPGMRFGRFTVLDHLGTGGMGTVLAAYDGVLDRRIALKLLRPAVDADQVGEANARLLREAQALARVIHPNIVTIHEAGVIADAVYLAMEFVDGVTLRAWLRTERTQAELLSVFATAARALHGAHQAGVVHRDFKPDNVMISADARGVRVLDFGISTMDRDDGRLAAGTPGYMAPEQHRGSGVDHRADQFALGVALFEALHQRRPFTATTEAAVAATHRAGLPRSAPEPRWLRRALERMLAPRPDDRFASMADVVAALDLGRTRTRRFAIAGVAAATLALGGVAVAATRGATSPQGPSCAAQARARVEATWSAAHHDLAARFARSQRTYAAAMAQEAEASLDRYAARWLALATDACRVDRHPDAATAALATHRAACLDGRLERLRVVTATLRDDARVEVVDHAQEIVASLGDLADCTGAVSDAPPPELAAPIRDAERQLAQATAWISAGLPRDAAAALASLHPKADAIAWPPLQVELKLADAELRHLTLAPWDPDILAAAEMATAAGHDRLAARAWALALHIAGTTNQPLDALAAAARATAAATRDPALIAQTQLAYARALNHSQRAGEALALCEAALADAERRPGATASELRGARECVIEARYLRGDDETALAPPLDAAIAATSRAIGPDYPGLAQLYNLRASITADPIAARPYAERALAITEQAYGPTHLTNVGALLALAEREADPAIARGHLARAAAITDAPGPDQRAATVEGVNVHLALASLTAADADSSTAPPALITEFERALERARRSGNTGLIAQVLFIYGGYEADWDVRAGVAKLRQAEMLMLERRDPRAWMARHAALVALADHGAWAQAIPLLAVEVEREDEEIPAIAMAKLEFALARGLAITRAAGATARADHALARLRDATDASAVVVTVAELRAEIEAWRAGHAR
ncbi:MAG: serine/threonine protein kinase [Myxococcales bacterium]|nr:serine/threonine protein kinase [Myxococcales bacterium]